MTIPPRLSWEFFIPQLIHCALQRGREERKKRRRRRWTAEEIGQEEINEVRGGEDLRKAERKEAKEKQ